MAAADPSPPIPEKQPGGNASDSLTRDRSAASKFTAKQQFFAMVAALWSSLAYLAISSYFAGLAEESRAPQGGFYLLTLTVTLGLGVLFYLDSLIPDLILFVARFTSDGGASDDEIPKELVPEKIRMRIQAVSRISFGLFMIGTLGWVTTYTGGTLVSPYSQLLVGCAVLAPMVSNSRTYAFIMPIAAILVYGYFGFTTPAPAPGMAISPVLVFCTTAITTLISVAVTVVKNYRKRPAHLPRMDARNT